MKRRCLTAAAVLAAVGLVAACGSSSSTTNSSSAGSTSATQASSTSKGPIKILTFGDITGLLPVPYVALHDGVQAAVNAFNASGGVQGRKVQLISCDTQLNPAQAAKCVVTAGSQGVVAAVPSLELLDNITTPLLEKQGIPLFQEPSTAAAQYAKNAACFINGPYIIYPATMAALAKAGAKSITVMQPAGVAGLDVLDHASNLAAAPYGGKVTTSINVPPTATNFSAMAAQATGSGQDGLFLSAAPPGLFSVTGDVLQTRPSMKVSVPGYLLASPQVLAAFSKIPGVKGTMSANYSAWPTDASVPGIKLFQQQLAAVNKASLGNEAALLSWIDASGAMQVLKTMTSGPITAASVSAAMQKATLDFQGVVPNWHYQYNTLGLGCVNTGLAYEGVYNGGLEVTPLHGDKPVQALTPPIVAYYKQALASFAK
jgi:ABC-type branched-subunit amino acid transport system substrate-binding protein